MLPQWGMTVGLVIKDILVTETQWPTGTRGCYVCPLAPFRLSFLCCPGVSWTGEAEVRCAQLPGPQGAPCEVRADWVTCEMQVAL